MKILKTFENFNIDALDNTVETWLPLFPGFYNTKLEFNGEEQIIDDYNEEYGTDYNYDDFSWGYEEYHQEISKQCVKKMEEFLKESDLVTSIKFQELISPKFYNYTTDSVNVEIKITKENYKNIVEFLEDHIDEFEDKLKDKYTSRPGFSSHYSPSVDKWLKELKSGEFEKEKHQIGSLLEIVAEILVEDHHHHIRSFYDGYNGFEGIEPTYTLNEQD